MQQTGWAPPCRRPSDRASTRFAATWLQNRCHPQEAEFSGKHATAARCRHVCRRGRLPFVDGHMTNRGNGALWSAAAIHTTTVVAVEARLPLRRSPLLSLVSSVVLVFSIGLVRASSEHVYASPLALFSTREAVTLAFLNTFFHELVRRKPSNL